MPNGNEGLTIGEILNKENIFLKISDQVIESDTIAGYLESTPKKYVDLAKVYSVLSTLILEEVGGADTLKPDITLLKLGDESEFRRVSLGIAKRRNYLAKTLKEEVKFEEDGSRYQMTFRGKSIIPETDDILAVVMSKSLAVEEVATNWINWLAENEGSILAASSAPKNIKRELFEMLSLSIRPEDISQEAFESLLRTIFRHLVNKAIYLHRLEQGEANQPQTSKIPPKNQFFAEFRYGETPDPFGANIVLTEEILPIAAFFTKATLINAQNIEELSCNSELVTSSTWMTPKAEVRETDVDKKGKGLYARENIAEGEKIVVWKGTLVNKETAEIAANEGKVVMRWEEDVYSIEENVRDISYTINHACDPNMWMSDGYTLVARREIKEGEELTADYALWEANDDYVSQWDCSCGSDVCRHKFRGSDWRLPELQERYKGHYFLYAQTLWKQ